MRGYRQPRQGQGQQEQAQGQQLSLDTHEIGSVVDTELEQGIPGVLAGAGVEAAGAGLAAAEAPPAR